MKKLLILLLALVLVTGFVGCTSEPEVTEPKPAVEDIEPEPALEEAPEPEPVESDATPEDAEAPVSAESEDDEEEGEDVTNSKITGALHRIEYGDNVVYLFGTIHAYREGWTPLAAVVEDAIDRADVFVAEMSGEEMANMDAMIPYVMFLPDGQTWVEFLPAEAYDHLIEMAEIWGVSYEDMNTWHPSFLIQVLAMELSNAFAPDVAIGVDASVDGYVVRRAAERGQPTLGLESAAQQIEILFTPPFEVVVAQVMALGTPDEMVERMLYVGTMADMAMWYETNDFQAFQDQFIREFADIDEDRPDLLHLRDMLVNFRSTYYAYRIADLLRETEEPTTFFVAVGISHVIRAMDGSEGLTDIVEQLGFMGIDAEPLWR